MHHDQLLKGIDSLDAVGCFALTELGYGKQQYSVTMLTSTLTYVSSIAIIWLESLAATLGNIYTVHKPYLAPCMLAQSVAEVIGQDWRRSIVKAPCS